MKEKNVTSINRKRNKIMLVLFLLIILGILGSFYLGNHQTNSKKKYTIRSRETEYQNAKAINDKTVGWIAIEGTKIDYPIQLGNPPTSDYYKDMIWTNDTLDSGRNRQLILGHNILNVSSTPLKNDPMLSRFEPLLSYVYPDFVEEHLYIQFTNYEGETALYKIYAVGFYESAEDDGSSYKEKSQIQQYIDQVKKKSLYDFSVEVTAQDTLITLATCTRFFASDGPDHFKVDARKVRENEKTENYSLKTTENYAIMK